MMVIHGRSRRQKMVAVRSYHLNHATGLAEALRDNVAMIALMHRAGVPSKSTQADGGHLFTIDI